MQYTLKAPESVFNAWQASGKAQQAFLQDLFTATQTGSKPSKALEPIADRLEEAKLGKLEKECRHLDDQHKESESRDLLRKAKIGELSKIEYKIEYRDRFNDRWICAECSEHFTNESLCLAHIRNHRNAREKAVYQTSHHEEKEAAPAPSAPEKEYVPPPMTAAQQAAIEKWEAERKKKSDQAFVDRFNTAPLNEFPDNQEHCRVCNTMHNRGKPHDCVPLAPPP